MASSPALTCCSAWLPVSAPERAHEGALVEQLPQALGAETRERMLDHDRALQPANVVLGVVAADAREAACKACHGDSLPLRERTNSIDKGVRSINI